MGLSLLALLPFLRKIPRLCVKVASAELGDKIKAVVSRGGRPDLAGSALPLITAPTLLVVGELDYPVIAINRDALSQLRCEKNLQIVPGATHLFDEPGHSKL